MTVATQSFNGAVLDPEAFRRVTRIAEREAGLAIPEAKRSMVQSRLNRRLRATGYASFDAYLDLVKSDAGTAERVQMISVLTTNVTHFFREDHHFRSLREDILPELARRARAGGRVRIWSAGCSAGPEPYSIAMTLAEAIPGVTELDVRILATDIDRSILQKAIAGRYDARDLAAVPELLRKRYFQGSTDALCVTDTLKSMISFRILNLIRPWPMRGTFDVVFCRNVLIYFSEDTQRQLWPQFRAAVAPGGTLFLGHSERMHDHESNGFRSVGVTTYRRNQA